MRESQAQTDATERLEQLQIEQAQVESMEGGIELQPADPDSFGLGGGAEEPVELMPITEEELAGIKSNTALIDDIISTQTEIVDVPAISDAFLDGIVAGANEEAVIGADIAITGTTAAITETALMVAPELAAALVVGGALYGLELGVENVLDIGASQDKKYHDERNNELGTHELDKREIDYQIKQLDVAKKYYKDQVEFHNFGDSEASKAQHEQDKAMLASIQHSIDAIHNQQRNGEPVYAVVTNGFDADKLNDDDKKEYDHLVKQVNKQQERVNYEGGDKEKLQIKQDKLSAFTDTHQNTQIANAYVNKATDEELEAITNDYIQNGGDIFEGIDPVMIDALGISEAIGTDDVNEQRIQTEQSQQNEGGQQAGDIAKAQGLEVATPGTS